MIPLLLLACLEADPPLPLPPSAMPREEARGRMVRAGAVRAFIARPREEPPGQRLPARLLRAPALDEAAKQRAIALAATGEIVLLIDSSQDATAAHRYLAALPAVDPAALRCEPEPCP